MAAAVLGFTEQFERIGTVGMVVIMGAVLYAVDWSWQAVGFALLLFFAIRPLSVWLGLAGSKTQRVQRGLIAWFGVRGIGSIYYLMYVFHSGLNGESARQLFSLTLTTITLSIVLHGISVTPLMNWYYQRQSKLEPAKSN